MAVEARYMNIFAPQLITNRDFIKTDQGNNSTYNTQMDCGVNPLPATNTMPEQLLPFNNQPLVCDPIPAKASMNKADSGLTYNFNPATRKRPRDSINGLEAFTASQKHKISSYSSLLDDDVIFQIHQQQTEIDRFVAEHTEKVILEIEERRKRQSRVMMSAIQEAIVNKLKEKEEEMERMGKLNWVLQERVKSLFMENQIWRDLAQTNEATAISLRSNLEQVLAQAYAIEDRHVSMGGAAAALADDAESSCCGSNDYGCREREREDIGVWRTLAGDASTADSAQDKAVVVGGGGGNRVCRKCGERESSVLLLPCRHLCLCTICGSTLLRACPVCNSVMNASVHVNRS